MSFYQCFIISLVLGSRCREKAIAEKAANPKIPAMPATEENQREEPWQR